MHLLKHQLPYPTVYKIEVISYSNFLCLSSPHVLCERHFSPYPSSNPSIWADSVTLFSGSQVNIDHFTKEITVKNLVEPSTGSFDVAQKRVHALMEKDSLPRFVRSEFYQEFIK